MGATLSPLQLREFLKNIRPDFGLEGAESKEVSGLPLEEVVVFHDKCIEFHLGIHKGIVWAKIDEELLNEQFVVFEPSWLVIWSVQEWLKVVEGHPRECFGTRAKTVVFKAKTLQS